MIRLLMCYGAGYCMPAVSVLALIIDSSTHGQWSGIDPIHLIYWIPIFFIVCTAMFWVSLLMMRVKRSRAPSMSLTLVAGVISGLSLLALPHTTGRLVSPYAAIGLALIGAGMIWLTPKERTT